MGAGVVREGSAEQRAWAGFRWESADRILLHLAQSLAQKQNLKVICVPFVFLLGYSGNLLSFHVSFCYLGKMHRRGKAYFFFLAFRVLSATILLNPPNI